MEALLEAVCERSPGGRGQDPPTTGDSGEDDNSLTDDSASDDQAGLMVEPLVEDLDKEDGSVSPNGVICQPIADGDAGKLPATLPRPCAGMRHPTYIAPLDPVRPDPTCPRGPSGSDGRGSRHGL